MTGACAACDTALNRPYSEQDTVNSKKLSRRKRLKVSRQRRSVQRITSLHVRYVQLNTCLHTYLLEGGRSVQSLRTRNFEPMRWVRGRASTGYIDSGLGNKAPEAGEYLCLQT